MQEIPEISVITPAYNSERYIAVTIESVINQTFRNWEMIVVDDGSDDHTKDIVLSYAQADSRIRYFNLEKNSGRPAVPRNYAVEKSLGTFVAFLDSDDIWLPEKLSYQLNFMKNKGLEFSFGPTMTDGGEPFVNIPRRGNRRELLRDNFISCLTVMMRNRIEYRPIFDEEPALKAAEDYLAWLRMYGLTDRIGYYDKSLTIYRTAREESIVKEYHRDAYSRMAKQFFLYSKAYLGGVLTKKEFIRVSSRVFFCNMRIFGRTFIVKKLRAILPRFRKNDPFERVDVVMK